MAEVKSLKKDKYISNPYNEYLEFDGDGNVLDKFRDYTGDGKPDDRNNNGNPYDDYYKEEMKRKDKDNNGVIDEYEYKRRYNNNYKIKRLMVYFNHEAYKNFKNKENVLNNNFQLPKNAYDTTEIEADYRQYYRSAIFAKLCKELGLDCYLSEGHLVVTSSKGSPANAVDLIQEYFEKYQQNGNRDSEALLESLEHDVREQIDGNYEPIDNNAMKNVDNIDNMLAKIRKDYKDDIAKDNLRMEQDKDYRDRIQKMVSENKKEQEDLEESRLTGPFKKAISS